MQISLYEDRKILIIGIQVSLIIHIILYIFLKIVPFPTLSIDTQKPIEIKIEEIRKETEKVEVKKIQVQTKKEVKVKIPVVNEEKKEAISKTTPAEKIQDKPQESSIKKETLKIEDENLKLLSQIGKNPEVSGVQKSNQEESLSFGQKLSDIDKSAEGTALNRSLLYKPLPPKLTSSILQPSIKAKIWISPSGNVEKVELINITGDAEIDTAVIKYLKKWKFNPIDTNKTQWAIVTVRFEKGE
ncbi:MAG: TonB family protein [Sulfurihydrogenibium sp.]|nr:TonB family protein [Sulfurihydrogenibium sp.]